MFNRSSVLFVIFLLGTVAWISVRETSVVWPPSSFVAASLATAQPTGSASAPVTLAIAPQDTAVSLQAAFKESSDVEELSYVAVLIVGNARGFVGLQSLRDFVLEPWRSRRKWKLDVFICCEVGAGQNRRLELLKTFAPHILEFNPTGKPSRMQFERIGMCARQAHEYGIKRGIQYSWFTRWRPDFTVYEKVVHPADLPHDCVGVRFRAVYGLANVSCGMMSFNWRSTMVEHSCTHKGVANTCELDDQVFFIPREHVETHLFDLLAERAKTRGPEFAAVVRVASEKSLTAAWGQNLAQVKWCPVSAAGTIPKYHSWFQRVLSAGCLQKPPYLVSCDLPWKVWMDSVASRRSRSGGASDNATLAS